MKRAVSFYKGFLPAVVIGLILSLPVQASEFNGPVSFSTKQLPSWAEEGWLEYRAKRAAGQLKEAAEVLTRVRQQALSAGIQRFDLPAAVLIQEGEEALFDGKTDEAVEMGQAATQWAPNDPNSLFFLAKALGDQHPLKPLSVVATYINGISSGLRDFWFSLYLLGRLVLILFAGLLGSFLFFFVLWLVRCIPLLVHTLHELSGVVLNRPAVWTLVISLLLMPLFVGLGMGFVVLLGLCLIWLYMTWSEHLLSSAFVGVVSLTAFWLPVTMSCFVADQSTELMFLSQIIRGNAEATGTSRLMEAQGGYDDNWPVLFSLAIQKKREGDYAEALERYQLLRRMEPDRSIILNNIGNLYFIMKQYDEAVSYYKQAQLKNPRDAVSHYNLNLVYRELLLFEDAEKENSAAQQINPPLIQSFHGAGTIDETFQMKMLWKIAFSDSSIRQARSQELFETIMTPLSLTSSPLVFFIFAGIVIALRLLVSRNYTATACPMCGRSICFQCERRILDVKTCKICWSSSKNIKRKADLQRLKIRQQWNHRVAQGISVFFPGAGHLYIGRVMRGFIFLAVFTGIGFTLLFRNDFLRIPGEQGILGYFGILAIGLGLVIVYFKVFHELVWAFHKKP